MNILNKMYLLKKLKELKNSQLQNFTPAINTEGCVFQVSIFDYCPFRLPNSVQKEHGGVYGVGDFHDILIVIKVYFHLFSKF